MLGFDVAQSTVSKYMVRPPKPPSQTWKTFLQNHAEAIAAIDMCVVPTPTRAEAAVEGIARRPRHARRPRNPLGSRAVYLWHSNKDTLYRIHGTVQPWTIGTSAESSPWADSSPAIPACRGWSLRPTTRSLGALRRRHSGVPARHSGRAAHRGTTAAVTTSASGRRSTVMRSRATDGRSASECQGE